ncbi:MAG: NADH-quinone oxidoreductase subunit N [Chitinophagaceae bacterium]
MNDLLTLMKSELIVTIIIIFLLFTKVASKEWSNESLLNFINFLLLINLVAGFFFQKDGVLFNDMFRTDKLIVLEKNILNLGLLIISLLAHGWLKKHRHMPEFYILLLSTLLGMFFMISAGNLLMFYLGLELSTIPLAALVNFDLEKRQSSEAAMKLIISSAFSSGFLLLGISFIYGTTGSTQFNGIAQHLDGSPLQVFAFILLMAGFAFKISAVPFHLWTADVYEGAPVAITAYLSVISKGAFFFVLVSVLYSVFNPMSETWYRVVLILSVLTMLVGNLFAIRQNNLKRLLAFSSIAQAGFVLVGISGSSVAGTASVVYFILVYIFSNLGAFAVVAVISSQTGKENISDYKGLYAANPFLSCILAISLFSLAGIPPTAGFFGKFFLLIAGAGKGNYIFISIAALNMVLSLYYYLVVVKAVFMDSNESPIEKLTVPVFPKISMIICLSGIVVTGIAGWIYDYIYSLSQ